MTVALVAALLLPTAPSVALGQYFGRNKVPYDRFDFDVLATKHFDIHFYGEERRAANDAARMLERWNARLAGFLAHTVKERKPIILYADHPDFQQTNVIGGQIDEGTGGVTESLLDRVALPLTGSYAESDHVLGHELVHVYQYDMANSQREGLSSLDRLPLWVVEGMAEYLSVGGEDAHSAMWLRDAVRRDDIPTIEQLNDGRRYFPYRYGQALWAYIGGTWGDAMVPRLFRESLKRGFDEAVERTLGIRTDSLSKRWRAAIREAYAPVLEGRTAPEATGDRVIAGSGEVGDYSISPSASPDGRYLAYFSTRNLRGVELLIADAVTGEVQATLVRPRGSSHFDALSFLQSAGAWSPDGRKLAFIAYADGDHEIDIVDVRSRKIERRIRPRGVGAVSTVAWSPDGKRLAFSGMQGGISDLYLFDLSSSETRRLTNDRFADLQPAWSPDGRTLVFATDRALAGGVLASGPSAYGSFIDGNGAPRADTPPDQAAGSDFDRLRYAPLRLATLDVATGAVRALAGFRSAKHINPHFSSDGGSVYFVSDADGVSDIYRLVLDSGALFRVTRTATGVSGVTATAPALSVARETGRLLFSVFENGGFHIAAVPAERAAGESLGTHSGDDARQRVVRLPADSLGGQPLIGAYLGNADTGLPADSAISRRPYRAGLRLAAIGQPSLGVGVGGVLGTQVAGGASAYFTDILGNHSLGVAVQASGTLRDVGGQMLYINSANRWTWGVGLERTPYLYAWGTASGSTVNYTIARLAVTGGSLLTQFAQSATRRLELSAGYSHYGYSYEALQEVYGGGGVSRRRTELDAPPSLGLAQGSAAYVGDDSFFGLTSPIAGSRFRFQVSPTLGSLDYQTLLLDYRRYFLAKPFTFAVRGLHYGRYGNDADSERLGSLFLGDGSLIRGYAYESFDVSDCSGSGTGSLASSTCPQFDKLLGSRVAVASAELRIPLLGVHGFGIIPTTFLPPLEIAPFVDAGVAWTGGSAPVWDFTRGSSDRTPVASAGVSSRLNLFGFAVLEVYYARPLQRLNRGGVFGFQLQPGW